MNNQSYNPINQVLLEQGSEYPLRQRLIRDIERETGHKLVLYVANLGHPLSGIMNFDVMMFSSVLGTDLGQYKGLDILIESPGGDANVAETLLNMCWDIAKGKALRAIVPRYAKSAATLWCFGTDEIMMGPTSELGPIDPQIHEAGPSGQARWVSAQAILQEFELVKAELEGKAAINPVYVPLLQGFSLPYLSNLRSLVERSKSFAVKALTERMLTYRTEEAEKIARVLGDTKVFQSHGQPVRADALEQLGLRIIRKSASDPLWMKMWELYVRAFQMLQQKRTTKLFESGDFSHTMSVGVTQLGQVTGQL